VNLVYLREVRLMSENSDQNAGSNLDSTLVNASVTAGQMLRQARLDAGLHIAALAVSLRVPVKRIEALESGQMDLLPDMVFVRALTSSICQALKIDAQPILEKLPKAALPRLNHDDVAINTPIGAASSSKSSWVVEIFSSPLLLGVLFLCVAAAGVYFWPSNPVMSIAQVPAVPSSPAALPEAGVSQAKQVIIANESTSALSMNTSANLAAPAPVSNVPVAEVVSSTPAASSAVNSSAPADSLVTFKATGETWVEVKSATGSTLFKKLLIAGEAAGTSGALPLTVIVGRADATQVEVRGKPIDLISIAKSNVARFEVK
jgi:cytoskeleton protein RodZ